MRVLIYGVNSQNKGAQLLLAAVAQRLLAAGHVPVVSSRDVTRSSRKEFQAVGMFAIERLGALRSAGLDWIPRSVDGLIPIVGDSQFDYVVDASGFSLTDSWGMPPVNSRLSRLARWTRHGIGFTMLPQAFGPFTRNDVASGVKKVVDYADWVWARDGVSLGHLGALGSTTPLSLAPDITIGLSVESPSDVAAGKTILVPNWNLAERSGDGGRERYVESLATIARTLVEDGGEVVGMSHEGERDLQLIQEVAARVPRMAVLSPASGVECKRIIAGSSSVIAGRYHALVSALSSGVPAIGHSWSHKYAALMDDFAVDNGLADPLIPSETIERVRSLDLGAERIRLGGIHSSVVARIDGVWDQLATFTRGA